MKKAFLGAACCVREPVNTYPWNGERKVESVSRAALEMPRHSSFWISLLTTRAPSRRSRERSLPGVKCFHRRCSTAAEPHHIVELQAFSTSTWPQHEPHQQLCHKGGLDVPTANRPDQAQSRHLHVTCKSLCGIRDRPEKHRSPSLVEPGENSAARRKHEKPQAVPRMLCTSAHFQRVV
jgi:hypothetical protein